MTLHGLETQTPIYIHARAIVPSPTRLLQLAMSVTEGHAGNDVGKQNADGCHDGDMEKTMITNMMLPVAAIKKSPPATWWRAFG